MKKTKEEQYNVCLENAKKHGGYKLGLMSSYTWINDPKRLLFVMSRYKFVAKMFAGMNRVLEIGCADAFGSRIVAQSVKNLTVTDFDPVFIENAKGGQRDKFYFTCFVHDILTASTDEDYDGVFALDVIEHINSKDEDIFMLNLCGSLQRNGSIIIGMPSLNSQKYASDASKIGHVNCKSYKQLQDLCRKYFHNVFIFSMNDEVVHTGFHQMANYFLALCCSPKG